MERENGDDIQVATKCTSAKVQKMVKEVSALGIKEVSGNIYLYNAHTDFEFLSLWSLQIHVHVVILHVSLPLSGHAINDIAAIVCLHSSRNPYLSWHEAVSDVD